MVTDISKLLEDMRGLQEQLELFFEDAREKFRYPQFFAFGDAEGYQQGLMNGRQTLREESHDRRG